jgi:hypothetical protein
MLSTSLRARAASLAMLAILAVPALSHAADSYDRTSTRVSGKASTDRRDSGCEQALQNARIMFELARTDGNVTPYMDESKFACDQAVVVAANDKVSSKEKTTSQE